MTIQMYKCVWGFRKLIITLFRTTDSLVRAPSDSPLPVLCTFNLGTLWEKQVWVPTTSWVGFTQSKEDWGTPKKNSVACRLVPAPPRDSSPLRLMRISDSPTFTIMWVYCLKFVSTHAYTHTYLHWFFLGKTLTHWNGTDSIWYTGLVKIDLNFVELLSMSLYQGRATSWKPAAPLWFSPWTEHFSLDITAITSCLYGAFSMVYHKWGRQGRC